MELKQLIDEAVADGPAHRPVEERLVAGRALVRRRRIGAVAAVVASAAVVGVGAAALAGGSDPGTVRDPGVAAATTAAADPSSPDPTTSPTEQPSAPAARLDPQDYSLAPEGQMEPVITPRDAPVRFDQRDRLVAKPGYTIAVTVRHPTVSDRFAPPGAEVVAVVAVDGPDKWFVLAHVDPDGSHDILTEPAGLRAPSLAAWLDAVAAAQDGGAGAR